PRRQACGVCLSLGHRTDVCPQPKQSRCTTCGANGRAMKDYEYSTHCVNCVGEHLATDHRGPTHQRTPTTRDTSRGISGRKGSNNELHHIRPHRYHTLPCRAATGRNCQATTARTPTPPSPLKGHPSHTKTNASPDRNSDRRIPSDLANKAKTQAPTSSRSQQKQHEQQRREEQRQQPEIYTPEIRQKCANNEFKKEIKKDTKEDFERVRQELTAEDKRLKEELD
ncbi:hypothetical protein HPB47_016363, partial [Ixodes persulcatus]